MKILGIDPGIGRMGWGVIEEQGSRIKALDYGCLETDKEMSTDQRLLEINKFLIKLIHKHNPDAISIEKLFFNKNVSTALTVGEARGVAIVTGASLSVPVFSYTPLEIKSAVVGYGKADKAQVGQMIKVILGLSKIPKIDDTSDALACAITHAFSHKILNLKNKR